MNETRLVLVETRTLADRLASILPEECRVEVVGSQLLDLPSDRLGIKLDDDFQLEFQALAGVQPRLDHLKHVVSTAKAVYLATSPTPAGEWLATQVVQLLEIADDLPVYRVWLGALDADSVTTAFQRPRPLDTHLAESFVTEKTINRLVGYLASPGLSKLLDQPVQLTPAVGLALQLLADPPPLVTEQDSELVGVFKLSDGQDILAGFMPDEHSPSHEALAATTYLVQDVAFKDWPLPPLPPFTFSDLARKAAHQLGLTPHQTLQLCWELYAGGWITYPLTADTTVSGEAQQAVRDFLGTVYGQTYLPEVLPRYHLNQGRHEALRPVQFYDMPRGVSAAAGDVYRLICQAFYASQLAPARLKRQEVLIKATGLPVRFTYWQSQVAFDGWLHVEEAEWLADPGPALKVASSTPVTWQRWFDEEDHPVTTDIAWLLRELDVTGVPPLEQARTLRYLTTRDLVSVDAHGILSLTTLGRELNALVQAHLGTIITPDVYKALQADLEDITDGQQRRGDVLRRFWMLLKPGLKSLNTAALEELQTRPQKLDETCPVCGKSLVKHPDSDTITCQNFPACSYSRGLKRQPVLLKAVAHE